MLRLIRINLPIMRPRQCRRGTRPEFLGALPYAFQPGGQRLGSARLALPNGFDAPTLRSQEFGIPPIPLHVRPAWVSSIGGVTSATQFSQTLAANGGPILGRLWDGSLVSGNVVRHVGLGQSIQNHDPNTVELGLLVRKEHMKWMRLTSGETGMPMMEGFRGLGPGSIEVHGQPEKIERPA